MDNLQNILNKHGEYGGIGGKNAFKPEPSLLEVSNNNIYHDIHRGDKIEYEFPKSYGNNSTVTDKVDIFTDNFMGENIYYIIKNKDNYRFLLVNLEEKFHCNRRKKYYFRLRILKFFV